MLMPQIEFFKLKESQRHNLETEALGWANNVLEHLKLQEQQRHNLATEDIEMRKLAETIRHNLVSENQADKNLAIQQFLANTKSGELAWKQIVDPAKLAVDKITAQGKLLSGQASMFTAQTREKELDVARQRADTESRRADIERSRVNSQNLKNLRDTDLREKEVQLEKERVGIENKNAETNKMRQIIEGSTSLQRAYENSQTPFGVDTTSPASPRQIKQQINKTIGGTKK